MILQDYFSCCDWNQMRGAGKVEGGRPVGRLSQQSRQEMMYVKPRGRPQSCSLAWPPRPE